SPALSVGVRKGIQFISCGCFALRTEGSFENSRQWYNLSRTCPSNEIFMPTEIGERILPHNQEAEKALLGSILLDDGALNVVLETLVRDDLYSESHRLIFEKMLALLEKS